MPPVSFQINYKGYHFPDEGEVQDLLLVHTEVDTAFVLVFKFVNFS